MRYLLETYQVFSSEFFASSGMKLFYRFQVYVINCYNKASNNLNLSLTKNVQLYHIRTV